MRAQTHIIGVLMLAAVISSVGLVPIMTRDVGTRVELPFSDSVFHVDGKEWLMVFAGFPGCGDTCPTTLMFLDRAYREVNDERLAVAFLNVLLHTPSSVSEDYAQAFNPEFIGYSVTAEERYALYEQMGLMADDTIAEVSDHKAHIFLYQRDGEEWMLRSVYQRMPSHETLVAHLRNVLQETGRS